MTWVKICGNRAAAPALAAAAAGADAIGFVFVPGVRREVTPAQAAAIGRLLPPTVERIGVFADSPLERVVAVVDEAGLTGVQLHGGETPAMVDALRRRLGAAVRIIKAWRLPPTDLDRGRAPPASPLAEHPPGPRRLAEYPPGPHLVEGLQPGMAGGSGKAWEWSRLASWVRANPSRPFILAGGLTPENVAAAIAAVRPWGVDVSSGVEIGGEKDAGRIRAFVAAVRAAAATPAAVSVSPARGKTGGER